MPNIFLWSAGASPTLLRQCQDGETIRQQIIGTFVLLTGLIALLTSFYSFYTVSEHLEVAVVGSLLWAAMIFTLDRFIVSTMRVVKKGNVYSIPFVQVLPRLVLAAAIGVSVGVPLELYLFRAEIDHFIQLEYHNAKLKDLTEPRSGEKEDHAAHRAECELDHGTALKAQEAMSNALQADINLTINGRDFTMAKSCGRHCEDLKEQKRLVDMRLADLRQAFTQCLEKGRSPAAARMTARQIEDERHREYLRNYEKKALQEPTILKQFEAFQKLSSGSDLQMTATKAFIPLLLVFFEIVPVLAKFLAGASTYELLAMQEKRVAIDMAERESFEAANSISRLKIEHDRQLALAEHESSTFKELHGNVHDRFKEAVRERIGQRLKEWQQSQQLEDDIRHFEQAFSQTVRESFGGVMSGLAGRRTPMPDAAPAATAAPDATRRPMSAQAAAVAATAAATSAATAAATAAGRAAFDAPRPESAHGQLPRETPWGLASMAAAYVRKLVESAATGTTKLFGDVLSSSVALVGGLPTAVLGISSQWGPSLTSVLLIALAVLFFLGGRQWARGRAPHLASPGSRT